MRQDLTDITLVVDRSGSMVSCREDAEGGINTFIEEQKKHEGDAIFTLVQFDTEYEFVHKGVPIATVPKYTLEPRGWTAYLDALGRAIAETGQRLAAMDEADRPGLVVFVIVTDGLENSSKEYTRKQVREAVERQRSEYNWQFTFLGADEKAFEEGVSLGIARSAIAQYDSDEKTAAAFGAASCSVSRSRSASMSGTDASLGYTDEERRSMQ